VDLSRGEAQLGRPVWLLSTTVCFVVCPILWDYKCSFSQEFEGWREENSLKVGQLWGKRSGCQ